MKINIYYGGRGIMGDPTIFVINKMQEILEELHVKVERYNLYELKKEISSLAGTIGDADGIILAATVEWFGVGGYMSQFLDSLWLFGNKEKISSTYMFPIVMSTAYGEREGKNFLEAAWETLGGKIGSGIHCYVEDSSAFELNSYYTKAIEKKAEDIYRAVSQKAVVFPSSTAVIKQQVTAMEPMPLTPQESEQLSKYVADDEYIKTQKEDIKELASHFRSMLGDASENSEDRMLSTLKKHFVPQKDFEASYRLMLEGEKDSIIMRVKDDVLAIEYGNIENPSVLCKMKTSTLEEITEGRMTFQRAFMSDGMKVKGDFKLLRMLDQLFVFEEK